MYTALWSVLPRPVWLKVTILTVAAAVILTACVLWVFPWMQQFVFPQEAAVGN